MFPHASTSRSTCTCEKLKRRSKYQSLNQTHFSTTARLFACSVERVEWLLLGIPCHGCTGDIDGGGDNDFGGVAMMKVILTMPLRYV